MVSKNIFCERTVSEMPSEENVWQLLVGRGLHEIRQYGSGVRGPARLSAIAGIADFLLESAAERKASDLHLEPFEGKLRIRYRQDGILIADAFSPVPSELAAALLSRLKVMGGMDIAQHRRPQDGHIRYEYQGIKLDIRVSVMPAAEGEMMVLRFMDLGGSVRTITELGFSKENRRRFESLVHRPSGLLPICGPMNSGKTTSLYAALQELNQPDRNLITLEDPIERQLSGVNQVQLNEKAGLDYAAGLRAILRQDAETILLGEIRDEQTAELAVRIALTGHLVMTTLHTENAVSAIFRLFEMGIPPYLMAATLSGVVAQRLVRCLCPYCKETWEVRPGSSEAALFGESYVSGMRLWRGMGCPHCHGTGYSGRMAIQEVLVVDAALREAILTRRDRRELSDLAIRAGMKTLWQDGLEKAAAGGTSLAEVRRVLYG